MDEELEIMHELLADEDSFSNDIDSEYEFDACQFFDFSRGETECEAEEAENWFRYAHEYPPSPFILKLKMLKAAKAKANQMKAQKSNSRKKEADKKPRTSSISDGSNNYQGAPSKESIIKGVKNQNQNRIPQTKSKSTVNLSNSKPSASSFMKPTASHLAKQNKERDTRSGGYGRVQKPLDSPGEKLRSPTIYSNQPTKRQKLEIGYLRKTAQLKHRTTFMHKIVKNTIFPPKPGLVFRPQNKSEVVQQLRANSLKGRPFKTKVGTCDNPVLRKQNSAPATVSEGILLQSQNFRNDKCMLPNNIEACNSAKVHPIKDGGFMLNVKHNSHLPTIELFKKLSLKPASESKVMSFVRPTHFSKVSKENVPRSLQQEWRRCAGKPNECGTNGRITQVKT